MELDNDSAQSILSQISPSSGWIAGDLWLLIFSRFPVETLARFRRVCKSWKTLISSPFFINLHHTSVSSATPPHLKPYILRYSRAEVKANRIPVYHPQPEAPTEHLRRDLHFPFRNKALVDVVRGVVCLSSFVESQFDSIILWNPAICKFVALPRRSYLSQFEASIGFGYDQSKNDFKVVLIWNPWNYPDRSLVPRYEVVSARHGLWKEARIIANLLNHRKVSGFGVFVNGTIHWRLKTPSPSPEIYSVLMFDCELEEFTTMELPQEIYKPSMEAVKLCTERGIFPADEAFNALAELTMLELMEHAGLLSVLVRRNHFPWHHVTDTYVEVELWVMQEHGVWEKLYWIRNGLKFEICRPAFGIRASFGPDQWIEFCGITGSYLIGNGHVYVESMFLMDNTKARSYTMGEIVHF